MKLKEKINQWLYNLIYSKKRARGFKIKEPKIDTTMPPEKPDEFNKWVQIVFKH